MRASALKELSLSSLLLKIFLAIMKIKYSIKKVQSKAATQYSSLVLIEISFTLKIFSFNALKKAMR